MKEKPPAYMPMPKHCGRGTQPKFDGVVCIDTIICYYYCTEREECEAYQKYAKERKEIRRDMKRPGFERELGKKKKRKSLDVGDKKPRRKLLL